MRSVRVRNGARRLAAASLCALTLALPLPAMAQVLGTVADIRVEGAQRVEPATVLSYMAVQPGQPASAAQINESVKRLYDTGLFEDVVVEPQGSILVVRVKENPIISQVAFEGNRRIDDELLAGEVRSVARDVFTVARAEADAEAILEVYRRSGRYNATVEPKVIALDQNRVNLVFEIDEGARTGVERISFVGNSAFSERRLRGVIATDESTWWNLFSSSDAYDPDRLEFDKELLRRYYLNNGYADFEVLSATAELAPDQSGFFITFTVDEGPQYRFGDIGVEARAPGTDTVSFDDLIRTRPGDVYSAERVEDEIEAISFRLGDLGYAFTQVEPTADKDEEALTIGVTYVIREAPRVFVERIDIEGNTRTLDRVVRREFELIEGDAFNAVQLQRSRTNIRALGFFSDVDIQTQEGSAPDRVVINTTVEEQSTGSLTFGAGFSSSENVAGEVTITERNLLGRGQYLRLRGRVSQDRQIAEINFTEPYFLGRDLAAGFDAYHTEVDNQDESSYSTRNTGFRPRVSFPLGQNGRLSPRYEIAREEIREVPVDASPLIAADVGTEWISSVGYTYTYDRRNDRVEPTRGYILTLDQDAAGLGGDARFVRSRASGKVYRELIGDEIIGSLEIEGGAIFGIGDYDVKTNDRFFLGGDSFRGFENSGLGPRDQVTDDALGGNYYGIARAEVTFPLPVPDEFGLAGGVFADAGTLWNLDTNSYIDAAGSRVTVNDDPELRASIGASLFWASPIGPVRLNFATPVVEENGDESEFFRFTAGTRF